MNESIVMREVRDKGRIEGRTEGHRESLVVVLQARFKVISKDVRDRIEQETDISTLTRWLVTAATVDDLAAFLSDAGL